MIQEDAWIENVEAALYLASSIICVWLAFTIRRKWWLAGLFLLAAVFLFFTFAEEISWGQRIFMIKTPRYFKRHNFQREISIHNLNSIQVYLHYLYVLAGGILSFGWLVKKRLARGKSVLTLLPDRQYMGYFLPTFLIYSYFLLSIWLSTLFQNSLFNMEGYLIWRDQEPAELLLVLGCFLWLLALNRVLAAGGQVDTAGG